MDTFFECGRINDLIFKGEQDSARDALIRLLESHRRDGQEYSQLLNNLIRQTGLFPYISAKTASWEDRFVMEAFKADIGDGKLTLHREQSALLKELIQGASIAVSAPTSFGKSFVVDSFIALTKPRNVMIIVPTIALADETRRRLNRKFSLEYKITTTPEVRLGRKNILIFPQERALGYVDKLSSVDILIVDEFYKASAEFDKERATPLLRAIIRLSKKAKQRYFLAPNISGLRDNPFTQGMIVKIVQFNTVALDEFPLYKTIKGEVAKRGVLKKLLVNNTGKTLIYAGTYNNIKKVAETALEARPMAENVILHEFASWLNENYGQGWQLPKLVRSGVGVHNGQLHRSLSQIQIKLFDDADGLDTLISTSSIIEGVNTSAENVIIWSNKNGSDKLDYFTYRNIVGRGGRMFRHFVGKIFVLDTPPSKTSTDLDIGFPDDLLAEIDEDEYRDNLTDAQISKASACKSEMTDFLGENVFAELNARNALMTNNFDVLRRICADIKKDPKFWAGIAYLNTSNPDQWERILYKIININRAGWGVRFARLVAFIKALSLNWKRSIPQLLDILKDHEITLDEFFQLERIATYRMASLLNDVNVIHRRMVPGAADISPFIARLSHAFLPTTVYQLEEYGLPRMVSRKIQLAGVLDFSNPGLDLHSAIDRLKQIGEVEIKRAVILAPFDEYLLEYFFEGIGSLSPAPSA